MGEGLLKEAHVATATSAGSTLLAWLGTANDIAQFAASIVAIVAGCFAIAVYVRRLQEK